MEETDGYNPIDFDGQEGSKHFDRLLRSRDPTPERTRLDRLGDNLRKRLARILEPAPSLQNQSSPMNGHTDRTNRLLSLWLDLQTAFGKTSRPRVVPWECQNPEVARLWAQITEPANQRALEEWLYQIAPGQMELWAQQALGECRRRREKPVED